MKKIVTHSGDFHADDVFAVATLTLYLDKLGEKYRIIRTRDQEIIEKGDYVIDVGRIYDEDENRFDHHQDSFKDTGYLKVPYSSFGLIWKHFGKPVCEENKYVWENFKKDFVTQIDANDSGIDIVKPTIEGLEPIDIETFIFSWKPSDAERTDESLYKGFLEAVDFAKGFIKREIKRYLDKETFREEWDSTIKSKKNIFKTDSLKALILPRPMPWAYFLAEENDFEFIVYQRDDGNWQARAVPTKKSTMNSKLVKKSWCGLAGEELCEKANVKDLVVYHKTGYLLIGKTKESILQALDKM